MAYYEFVPILLAALYEQNLNPPLVLNPQHIGLPACDINHTPPYHDQSAFDRSPLELYHPQSDERYN